MASMRIFIDEVEVVLLAGMTVRHALMSAGLWSERAHLRVRDEWGNEVGFNGALHDGMKIITERRDRT